MLIVYYIKIILKLRGKGQFYDKVSKIFVMVGTERGYCV